MGPPGAAPANTDAPEPAVTLQLLHTPGMRIGDTPHPLAAKDAALLAMLVLQGSARRAEAAAMLWPEVDTQRAHANLRQRLFRLRRAAGRDVVLQGSTLLLAPGIGHDLDGLADKLRADPLAAAGELLGSVDHADAPELAAWVGHAREQWRSARRDLLAEIAADFEKADRVAAALPYAERLARDEPLHEHAQRHLMRLHYRRGDRSAALAVHERLRAALAHEFGQSPSKETLDLLGSIESSLALPVAPPPAPVTVLRPPRLVGRVREWAAIEAAWLARQHIVVGGEPGMGKSRLLNDFAQAKNIGVVVQGRPGDTHVLYALLARLLRRVWQDTLPKADTFEPWARAEIARLVPELGPAAPGALETLRLQQAVEHVLERAAPGGVAVDDFQFGDAASQELLQAIIARPGPLRWLLAWRSAELPATTRAWLAQFETGELQLVELQPLPLDAVAELLLSLAIPGFEVPAWAPRLHRHSGGNPMFILETLLAVLRDPQAAHSAAGDALPVPANLRELVGRRLTQLSPAALRLARLVAVAGQDFSIDLGAKVLGLHPLDLSDPWQELVQAQVMDERGFAHDVIAEVALQSVPALIARWLHAALARLGAEHTLPPARLGAHWAAAGEMRAAAEAFITAGRNATQAGRVAEQITLLQQAADCAEAAGERALAFEALRWLVVGVLVAGASRDLGPVFERLAASAGNDFERGEAARMQAIFHMSRFDHDAVVKASDRAIEHLGRSDHHDAGLAALFTRTTRSSALARSGAVARALRESEQLMGEIRALTDPPWNLLTNGLAEHAHVLNAAGERERGLHAADEAIALARAGGHVREENSVLRVSAQILLLLGRTEEAQRRATQAVALHERMGASRGVVLQGPMVLGWSCRDLGHYTQALHWLEDAHASALALGNPGLVAQIENQLSLTWLHLGRADKTEQVLSEIDPAAVPHVHFGRRLHRAWMAASAGRSVEPFEAGLREARACRSLPGHEHLMIDLLLATLEAPQQRASAFAAAAGQALATQLFSLHALALAGGAEALAATEPQRSAALASSALQSLTDVQPFCSYRAGLAWRMLRLLHALPVAPPRAALQHWAGWVRTQAAAHVPEASRASFLERNAENRELLAFAARAG